MPKQIANSKDERDSLEISAKLARFISSVRRTVQEIKPLEKNQDS